MRISRDTRGDLVSVGALLPGVLERKADEAAVRDLSAGIAELRGQVESDAEQERDRCLRLGREVRWLREQLDAAAADLTEERQRREWLDSDVRHLIERVEALEGAAGR